MARRLQPNLIFMDYRLPVMNGLEAASRMKEENETKHIPIIMLTNEDLSLEDQKALKELGVDAYVHKGDDFKTLVESIKKVLGKK
ncbi:response regulator [Candidatus Falkowbacteria bacterium]|nr:response regulator [Candidatus Falkowbacteria bacterium]